MDSSGRAVWYVVVYRVSGNERVNDLTEQAARELCKGLTARDIGAEFFVRPAGVR